MAIYYREKMAGTIFEGMWTKLSYLCIPMLRRITHPPLHSIIITQWAKKINPNPLNYFLKRIIAFG